MRICAWAECLNVLPDDAHPLKKYCSEKCKDAQAYRLANPPKVRTCLYCEDPLPDNAKPATKFCKPRCRGLWHTDYGPIDEDTPESQKVFGAERAKALARPPISEPAQAVKVIERSLKSHCKRLMNELVPSRWHCDFIAGVTGHVDDWPPLKDKDYSDMIGVLERGDRLEIARAILKGARMAITFDERDYRELLQIQEACA